VFGFAAVCPVSVVLPLQCVIVLLSQLFVPNVSAACMYDLQTLLGIRSSMVDFFGTILWDGVFQPPFSRSFVPPICQPYGGQPHRNSRRCRRKRGKRARVQVKLRWLWKQGVAVNPGRSLYMDQPSTCSAPSVDGSPSPWLSVDLGVRLSCLRPVFPDIPCRLTEMFLGAWWSGLSVLAPLGSGLCCFWWWVCAPQDGAAKCPPLCK